MSSTRNGFKATLTAYDSGAPGDPYFEDLRHHWSEALKTAHLAIPRPSYGSNQGG